MEEGYTSLLMAWAGRNIVVSYQANWLNSDQWHIELRSDDRLPVTETGYRSLFVPEATFVDEAEIPKHLRNSLRVPSTEPLTGP